MTWRRRRASSHSGKVAVITGAAAGNGQAYARRLAADGASIVVADAQEGDATVSACRGRRRHAVAVRCDVSAPGTSWRSRKPWTRNSAAATSS
jgi:NAD(P)-dependent dehydrogenase (short-subunit alcohol dehydrogenase family)